ncbi:hypothetical protein DFH28DRAFT_890180 [Melampsora americana]|nr:hypothetical protein DFH28DRAFT_890180 [Melampsora americana]
MALPGEEIRTEVKRQKKEPRAPPGSARQRLASLQDREAQASVGALANRPIGPRQIQQTNEAGENNEEENNDADAYNHFVAIGNEDLESPNDENNVQIFNRADYFRSVTYQERTLRQEANWRAVIPALFHEFMLCSQKTFQWGHPQLWNHDWNLACKCRDWQRHEVTIDTIDLIGRSRVSIRACDCTSDLIRLINMGYVGTCPLRPRTAVSIRLLRFHHMLWKYSSVRLAPFVECLDEFLDAHNTIFFVQGSDQRRDLRKCISQAVDVYREMIRLEEELTTRALRSSPLDELADNCPSCFGPNIAGKRHTEPDLMICLDANFQQRRHLAASAAWRGDTGILPSLFMDPADVKRWKDRMELRPQRGRAGGAQPPEVIDPCSAQHTAANDTRGRQTWRGCDETGLMGMACRHDHLLKFINIVQSGEKGYYPLAMLDWILRTSVSHEPNAPHFGILYDIGCNMEKSIIKVCTV